MVTRDNGASPLDGANPRWIGGGAPAQPQRRTCNAIWAVANNPNIAHRFLIGATQ